MARRTDIGIRVGASLLALIVAVGCGRQAPDRPAAAGDDRPLPDPLPEIVARVNGQILPLREVKPLAEAALFKGTFKSDQRPQAYRQMLQQAIDRELLFQEAIARGVSADQTRMEAAENKARSVAADDADWLKVLAAQGLNTDTYKLELRVQYTVNALVGDEEAKASSGVTNADVLAYYKDHLAEFTVAERYRLRHILLKVPTDISFARKEEFRTKAEGILVQARLGADFATLAAQFSEDSGSRARGGELPVFGKGEIDPRLNQLAEVAATLKVGQVSDVLEMPIGFDIVKLEAKLPGGARPFPEVAEATRQTVIEQRRAGALAGLLRRLRSKATIETYL